MLPAAAAAIGVGYLIYKGLRPQEDDHDDRYPPANTLGEGVSLSGRGWVLDGPIR